MFSLRVPAFVLHEPGKIFHSVSPNLAGDSPDANWLKYFQNLRLTPLSPNPKHGLNTNLEPGTKPVNLSASIKDSLKSAPLSSLFTHEN